MSKGMLAWTGEYDNMTSPVMQLCKRAEFLGMPLDTLLVHACAATVTLIAATIPSGSSLMWAYTDS